MMYVCLITLTEKIRCILRGSTSFVQFFILGNTMLAFVLLGMMVRASSSGSSGDRENGNNAKRSSNSNTCLMLCTITGSDSLLHAHGIKCRRAKRTVRAIDDVYFCEEVVRNRVSGFHNLSDASLQRILETNGMETRTRVSTRWTSHLRARRRRAIGRYLRLRESLQEAEGILLRYNEHMDAAATWANERWHDLEMGTLFAFDDNWANRAWHDLELFDTMDSNDMAYNNLQAKDVEIGYKMSICTNASPYWNRKSKYHSLQHMRMLLQMMRIVTQMLRTSTYNIANITVLFTALWQRIGNSGGRCVQQAGTGRFGNSFMTSRVNLE
jgi:hypothetical protein